MDFGKKIKALRIEKGLSLPDLATRAKVSKGFLYQLENGEQENPSLDTLNKLATALEVTLADLLEKKSVMAKRFVPDALDPNLADFIVERRKANKPIHDYILEALYVIQERKGKSIKTKDDWRFLYESIERSTE